VNGRFMGASLQGDDGMARRNQNPPRPARVPAPYASLVAGTGFC